MNNLWQLIQQNPRFIILLLFIGVPIVRGIAKKLGEQAAIRRAEIERERREIERLRTGRMEMEAAGDVPGPVAARTPAARTAGPAPSARATRAAAASSAAWRWP